MPTLSGGTSASNQDQPLFVLTSTTGFSLQTSCLKSFTWSKQANFQAQSILNRSSAVYTYENSSAIQFNVVIDFIALGQGTNGDDWTGDKIQQCVQALASLLFPQQQGLQPPGLCHLTYGSGIIFNNYPCIVTSVAPTYGDIYDNNGDAFYASVTLSLTGIELQFQSNTDFGGVGQTFTNLSFT